MSYDCIFIVGPTASGKTKLSIELAKKYNGEIINADSQQLIKNLSIGTAKITSDEMKGIKHHLLDLINPGEDFSVSEFSKLASQKIEEINSKNKLPIVVGGTGFYINSLLYNYTFGNSFKSDDIRKKYEDLAKKYGKDYVYNILKEIDEESARSIHSNDLKRVIRAIEIYYLSGNKKSNQHLSKNNKINPLVICLTRDRNKLYKDINERVDLMIAKGLINEVEYLRQNGFYNNSKIDNNLPIGYSEWGDYYNNIKTRQEVIEQIKLDTRHYAKRQITWFKKLENAYYFNVDELTFDIIIEKIDSLIKNNTTD